MHALSYALSPDEFAHIPQIHESDISTLQSATCWTWQRSTKLKNLVSNMFIWKKMLQHQQQNQVSTDLWSIKSYEKVRGNSAWHSRNYNLPYTELDKVCCYGDLMYVAILITTCSGTLVHQLLHRNEQNTVQWQLNVNGKKKK